MADLNYTAAIDVKGVQNSLESLKGSLSGLAASFAGAFAFNELVKVTSDFENLRTTLGILYKDVGTGAAAFDEIKKFAASSVFSVADLTETVIKLKAAGLDPTISMLTLFANVSSVAADKVGALQAITDLYSRTTAGGLGLEDLNRLADRGIPVFDILSKKLGISRLEITKVGQSAEGAQLILKALESGLNDAFGGASAARAGTLAQATSNLSDTFANFGDIIGRAGFNQGLAALATSFSNLITQLRPLALIVGVVLGGAFEILADNIKIVTVAVTALLAAMAVGTIVKITTAIWGLNAALLANPAVRVAAIFAGLAVTLGIVSSEASAFNQLFDETNKKLDESNGKKVLGDGEIATNTEDLKGKVAALNEELKKFRVEMSNVSFEFSRYNANIIDQINLENQLIGKSKEYADAEKAKEDIIRRGGDEIAKLTLQREKLNKQELKEGRGQIIDEQINKIRQATEEDTKRVERSTENANRLQIIDKIRLFGIQNEIDKSNQLTSIQNDFAKLTLPEIEKKYYDIETAAKASAKAAIEAEEARLNRKLDPEEAKKYYDAAIKGTEDLKKATTAQYEESRKFSTGWKQAFNQYADDAANSAKLASNVFGKFTSGMEDAIVNFAKTGKLEFKGLMSNIVEEILRAQIRQLIAQSFGGAGKGGTTGSIFSGIGRLLGFANGGIIPTDAPVLVGERGPELLVGAQGRTVIPNNQIGSAAGSTVINYNISAVDALSFKQMVARDPSFIHAVAQQGSRTVPQTRR